VRATTTIETARLRLRPFTLDDLDAHARLYAAPEVTRWLADGPWIGPAAHERSERTVRRFVAHWREHGFGVWAVEERASGRVIGQCGLNRLDSGEIEILWALEPATWERGYGTEAAKAALVYAFDVLRLDRVVALARPQNGPSRRIMDKLGLRWERDVDAFGAPAVYYAIDRP
jgi:ribosomal-protein-alanine N-acetyltransferase